MKKTMTIGDFVIERTGTAHAPHARTGQVEEFDDERVIVRWITTVGEGIYARERFRAIGKVWELQECV